MVVAWGCCFLLAACARALRRLPALLCCEAMVWAVTFLAFPLRMLTAVDRERKLGRLVAEMQAQMEDLVWENRDLADRLRAALREHDSMEALLDDMEDEHEGAFARIHALETQVKGLRQENMRLNEHKGKSEWDTAKRGRGGEDDAAAAAPEREEVAAKRADPASALALTAASPVAPRDDIAGGATALALARRRSLFSLAMSVAVGAVAWSADAPCLPLLAGLFAVVGVSMRSVSRLRPAADADADAVALLSLNWFLLGLLTSPMLPAVVPRAVGTALTWLADAAPP